MKRKLYLFVHFVATKVHMPWRVRTALAAAYAGTKEGVKAFSSRVESRKPIGAPVGRRVYWLWRLAEARRLRASDAKNSHNFVFIVEETPKTTRWQLRKTLHSLRALSRESEDVKVLPSGTSIQRNLFSENIDFIIFLRAGSVVSPHLTKVISAQYRKNSDSDIITFDSDLRKFGWKSRPYFRAKFAPEMLISANCFDRAFALSLRKSTIIPKFELNDLGIWECLLALSFSEANFLHVPRVLLSEEKHIWGNEPTQQQISMIRQTLEKAGRAAQISVQNGSIRYIPVLDKLPTVSIVIPSRHSRTNLFRVLSSLNKTDYVGFDVSIIDNGENSFQNRRWYEELDVAYPLSVIWHDEPPFNYSTVNNLVASKTSGEILVFLNDDTEVVDDLWLKEQVGLLCQPGVGTVGFQHINGDGLIQHGGVLIGPGGFADNLFAGLRPNSWTMAGSTRWYRNTVAVTGACVALRRTDFDSVGGFDDRFTLCGSDVVLGLDLLVLGKRNVISPIDAVRHFESLTRGTDVPIGDFFASYWRYLPWLQNGDPYLSSNLSQLTSQPKLCDRRDAKPVELSLRILGRPYREIKQSGSISQEAKELLATATISRENRELIQKQHESIDGLAEVKTINWFLPDIDTPFFGGFNTAFRIASKLAAENGVKNRFVFLSPPNEEFFRSAVAAAFENLRESEFAFYDGTDESMDSIPFADASIATLWLTAYHVARSNSAKRFFYLIQDFEPGFYPASSMYAMAEQSYRLGLFGICNTPTMASVYREDYNGEAFEFLPAVDRGIYKPPAFSRDADSPITIFVYARDHFRNCSELALGALGLLKQTYGDRLRVFVAGARYLGPSDDFINLGLMDYREAASLYQHADIGLTLQISRHPSYLPLELMACGVPMVAPKSKDFSWLFKHGENSLLADMTIDGIYEALSELIDDDDLREKLSNGAIRTINDRHSSWHHALAGVYAYLNHPS